MSLLLILHFEIHNKSATRRSFLWLEQLVQQL
jgi:hypothetical protein